ncbi:MORN repeat [Carpediemonas membranifera]|uniref:MORN repeat-containing protein 3 n=1 Tax=Carpediemonas membranifera TaxID=201153 RepID=A0A8J6B3I6_9EUKA|nr:MORN repeat [Carpediemonas membranifera]|eukprot:KAG9393529.1 MORN repeat [Carpediemonas membranifera]
MDMTESMLPDMAEFGGTGFNGEFGETTQMWKTWETKALRHGARATIYSPNGKQYKGEWKDGKKHGVGIQIYKNGDKYEGEWADNKPSGHGIYSKPAGPPVAGKKRQYRVIYDGDWQNGRRHGFGTLNYPDGSCYQGEWADGQREGYGIFTGGIPAEKQGKVQPYMYRGEYVDDLKCGKGVEILANGNVFEGEFAGDVREGLGCFYYISTRRKTVGLWVANANRTGSFEDWADEDDSRVLDLWLDNSGPWPGVAEHVAEVEDGLVVVSERRETVAMPETELKNPARVVMNSIREYVEECAAKETANF